MLRQHSCFDKLKPWERAGCFSHPVCCERWLCLSYPFVNYGCLEALKSVVSAERWAQSSVLPICNLQWVRCSKKCSERWAQSSVTTTNSSATGIKMHWKRCFKKCSERWAQSSVTTTYSSATVIKMHWKEGGTALAIWTSVPVLSVN